MSESRAERRRRERAEAKLMARIDRQYGTAGGAAARLIPQFEAMLEMAERNGWDDVAGHVRAALDAVHAGEGIEARRHAQAAAEAIDTHTGQK